MHLLSIQVGRPRPVAHRGELVQTGIFKQPVAGRVQVTKLGLAGDGQADLVNHGGEYKAVFAYQHEMYDVWRRELSRDDFTLGQFGENLTVTGMPDDEVCIGDVYRIGSATLQVTQPRTPCFKLGLRLGDPSFVKRYFNACRVGFYLRVLEAGDLAAGNPIALLTRPAERFTIERTFQLRHLEAHQRTNLEEIRRLVTIDSLSPTWREALAERLASA
jgi:MOSC domain-containing protein YiiM